MFFEKMYSIQGYMFYAITLFKFHNDKPVFVILCEYHATGDHNIVLSCTLC
jgi:hypothetical protein